MGQARHSTQFIVDHWKPIINPVCWILEYVPCSADCQSAFSQLDNRTSVTREVSVSKTPPPPNNSIFSSYANDQRLIRCSVWLSRFGSLMMRLACASSPSGNLAPECESPEPFLIRGRRVCRRRLHHPKEDGRGVRKGALWNGGLFRQSNGNSGGAGIEIRPGGFCER